MTKSFEFKCLTPREVCKDVSDELRDVMRSYQKEVTAFEFLGILGSLIGFIVANLPEQAREDARQTMLKNMQESEKRND